jgi:hypothetical protein
LISRNPHILRYLVLMMAYMYQRIYLAAFLVALMPVLHAARQLEAVPALGGCYFDAASSTLMYFEGRTAPVSRPEAGLACKIRRNMDTCAGLHVQQDPDLQGRCVQLAC